MKKSIVISLVAIIILFCTAIYTFASTGIVTTDTLRLRKEASTEASIVALLSMNEKIEILEEKDGWYKVSAEVKGKKVEGFVAAKYIEVEKTETPVKNEIIQEEPTVEEEETNTEENKNEETENQEEKILVKTLPVETKIYITPLMSSIVLNTLTEEKRIEITSEVNGWSYITSGDTKGWVRTEDIIEKEVSQTEQNNSSQKTGYISGNSVSLRKEATASSDVILKLLKNVKVNVLSEENGWAKVEYNGNIGYVSSKYISEEKIAVTSRSSADRNNKEKETKTDTEKTTTSTDETKKESTTSSKGSATGSEIVSFAKKYLGSKYVYGGSSPSGFDCSGFTSYVYKNFGCSLSRTSSGQSSQGKSVSKEELQPGDLVCFSKSSGSKKIGHVGIYTGGGKFIHAANPRKGVIISNLTGSGFYFVKARRVI